MLRSRSATTMALTCLAGIVLAAQQPTFRTGTTLVEFSVVALDEKGRPVIDLRKDDFVVLENGTAKEIAFFRFGGTAEKREAAALPPGTFTNRPEYTADSPRGVTAIVLDSVNSRLQDQTQAREQLLRYLATIPDGTRVALYQTGWRGVRVLHDYTSDLDSLRAKVRTVIADAAAHNISADTLATSDAMSFEARELLATALEEMRRQDEGYGEMVEDRKRAVTRAALESVGAHLAGAPGRKSVVWLTLGLPILTMHQGFLRIHEREFRQMAQTLASQGIAVYPVDIQGLSSQPLGLGLPSADSGPGALRRPGNLPAASSAVDHRLWATLEIVADVTGGRFSRNTNDMAKGLTVAGNDLRGSYIIGFYTAEERGGWRPVELKTSRPGVRLTHRRGYQLDAPQPEPVEWADGRWQSVITRPLGSTMVRLDARFDPIDGGEARTYHLQVQIAADDLHFQKKGDDLAADVEIAIAEKVANEGFGYRKAAVALNLPTDGQTAGVTLPYSIRWKLREDAVTLRVIVRDRSTGRYGTLDIPVGR